MGTARRRLAAAALALCSVAGCGDAHEDPPARAPAAPVVAALGDSIVAGSPAWDPDPGVRATLGTGADRRSQFEYWARRADPRLSFRNCGVFGERTDQIAGRL